MSIYQALIIAYVLLSLGIGAAVAGRQRTTGQFFIASGALPLGLGVAFAFAELTAGAATIGTAADSFRVGMSGMVFKWGGTVGCLLTVWLVARFYRLQQKKHGVMSVAGAFGHYFDQRTQMAVLVFTSLVYIIVFAQQPVAAAAIVAPAFGINTELAIWAAGIFFIVVTVLGGFQGLVWMNVLHTVVLIGGLGAGVVAAVRHVGGFEGLRLALPDSFFSLAEPSLWTVLAWSIGTGLSFLTAGSVVNVIFSTKSLKTGRWTLIWAGILTGLFGFLPGLIGMSAAVALPGIRANDVLFLMADLTSPLISTAVALGVLAALFDASAFLLVIVTQLTKDIYKPLVRPDASEKEQMLVSRVLTVVVGLGATYIGLHGSSILGALLGALQIRAVAAIVLVAALAWRRVDSRAAFWSIVTGSTLAAVWNFAGSPFGVAPLWPSIAVTAVTLIVLTLLTGAKVSAEHKRYAADSRAMGDTL